MIKSIIKYILPAITVFILGLFIMNDNSLSAFTKNQLNNEVYTLILEENKSKELIYYERLNDINFIQHPVKIEGINPSKDLIFQIQSRINGDIIYTGPFKNELNAIISKDFYTKKNDSLAFYIYDNKNYTGYAAEQELSYPTWIEGKTTIINFLSYRQPDSKTGLNISYKIEIK